ncbi:hypothetical protein Tco_0685768 [Tanacetum coccineum]
MRKNKSYEKHLTPQALYDVLVQSLILDEDDMEKAKTVETSTQTKRRHDDKDQDPPAGPDQGLKKKKTSKDAEPSKKPKSISASKDTDMPLNQGDETGNTDEQPDVEAITKDDWFKKPARPPTPDPEWNTRKSVDDAPEQSWLNDLANAEKPPLTFDDLMSTHIYFSTFAMNRLKISKLTKVDLNYPEGNRCPYDLSKPLPLQECQGHLTVPIDFFFKNDLEYLRKGSTDRKYMASTTKKKAVKYKIEGIEDTVPKLCSPIKVAYDKYAALGISHWGPKRQRFYEYMINRVSRHDVYSTMRILSVTSGTVDKWYGYGYPKEIVVRRADRKLHKFMEGEFPRLHLNDIEDMLLLVVQNKLFNLEGDVIIDLEIALHMYTRRIVIQKRVEDLQLGVESYQKKLNISKPHTQGVIYEGKLKRKRLTRTHELYKLSDGTLTLVRNTLQQRLINFRLEYNKAMKRRLWTKTDQKWTCTMIKDIDQ